MKEAGIEALPGRVEQVTGFSLVAGDITGAMHECSCQLDKRLYDSF
jgi:hypothetical protein